MIFTIVKIFISISEIQIARSLADKTELKLRFSIDVFNHTKYPIYSVSDFEKNQEKKLIEASTCLHKEPQSPQIHTVPLDV